MICVDPLAPSNLPEFPYGRYTVSLLAFVRAWSPARSEQRTGLPKYCPARPP